MSSLQGQLLVASPHFVGAPLPRAVILMVSHNEDGAAGVMLNNDMNERLLRFSRKLRHMGKSPQAALGMFQLPAPTSTEETPPPELTPDSSPAAGFAEIADMDPTHFVPPPEAPAELAPHAQQPMPVGVLVGPQAGHHREGHSPPFRVIVGGIGWPKARLDEELSRGLWMSTPATPDLLFDEHEDLWRVALQRVGTSILSESLGVAPAPHPFLN